VNLAANQNSKSLRAYTDFYFRGSGFSDKQSRKGRRKSFRRDRHWHAGDAIKTAIENAGNGGTQAATAFKNAGIQASILTDTNGSHLAFTSSQRRVPGLGRRSDFECVVGQRDHSSNPLGKALLNTVTGGAVTAVTTTTFGASGAGHGDVFRIQGSGLSAPVRSAACSKLPRDDRRSAASPADRGKLQRRSADSGNFAENGDRRAGARLWRFAGEGRTGVATSGDLNGRFGLGSFQSSAGAGRHF